MGMRIQMNYEDLELAIREQNKAEKTSPEYMEQIKIGNN